MQRAELAVKSRGLKYKLISIAIAAGICISATLFALEYFDYRKSSATRGAQGEQSLHAAELHRLDLLAGDLATVNARALEGALSFDETDRVRQIAAELIDEPDVIGVTISDAGGTVVAREQRDDPWVAA